MVRISNGIWNLEAQSFEKVTNGRHFNKSHLKSGQKHPDFECFGLSNYFWPFEYQTSPVFKSPLYNTVSASQRSVFQWSGSFENQTKWQPICFWTFVKQNFKTFSISKCLVFQCPVFKPPLYFFAGVQYSGKPLTAFSSYEFIVTRTQSFIAGLKPELLEVSDKINANPSCWLNL